MSKKIYILFFLIEMGIVLLATSFQKTPGYMDADYYFANAIQISSGNGFQEPFLWNYLDDPQGIPHPSFTYWMPLASIVSSISLFIFNAKNFWIARIPFIFLSGFIPVLTMHIIYRLSKDTKASWIAGAVTIFSGFYLFHLALPETFVLYMLLGACFFEIGLILLARENGKSSILLSFVLAMITGLFHLSRADGLLWVAAGLVLIVWTNLIPGRKINIRGLMISTFLYGFGYLLVTGLWYYRNIQIFGSLFPLGGTKTLWLTDYNQTFLYPSAQLSFSQWWDIGFIRHLGIYLSSLWTNLQTIVIVQGEIFLLPLMVLGIVAFRKEKMVKFLLGIFIAQFVFSTFLFPFSGARGGFFHSGSAFQPFIWAMAGVGFWKFLDWGRKKRGWKYSQALKVFAPAIILLTILFSGMAYIQKVVGDFQAPWIWDKENDEYVQIEKLLSNKGIPENVPILIKNPPGYFISSGRPAIVIPDGDVNVVLQVAQKYHAAVIALDKDHVLALDTLYEMKISFPSIKHIDGIGDYQIFLIESK